jgi:hypothetical protein
MIKELISLIMIIIQNPITTRIITNQTRIKINWIFQEQPDKTRSNQ